MLIFIAFVFLRIYNLDSLHLSFSDGIKMNIQTGFLLDLGILFICFGLSSLFRKKIIPVFIFSIVYQGQVSYSLYLKFFQTELDIWHIGYHFFDLGVIKGSSFALAYEIWFLLSVFSFFIFLLKFKPKRSFPKFFAFLILGLFVKQSPVWFKWIEFDQTTLDFKGNILNENIWVKILRGSKNKNYYPLDKSKKLISSFLNRPYPGEPISIHSKRDVFIIFIESFRAIEFNNEEIRNAVMPEFSKLVKEKGIFFKTAYSSSIDAGQTVRGVFQTICSFYPNFNNPAVYLTQSSIKLDCLPEILKKSHYKTISIVPTQKNFHNTYSFERLHGIDHSFGKEEIEKELKEVELFEDWAVSDNDIFKFSEIFLKEKSTLYLQLLTMGTHFPYEGSINPKFHTLVEKFQYDSEGHVYLSRLNDLDLRLTEFIQKIFSLRKNPLIVVLGDHSISQGQQTKIDKFTQKEATFRIPIVFFGAKTGSSNELIHQIDVSPTVSSLLLGSGYGTWLGKDFFKDGGSPFILHESSGISSRYKNDSCYSFIDQKFCGYWSKDVFEKGEFIQGKGYPVSREIIESIWSVIALGGVR